MTKTADGSSAEGLTEADDFMFLSGVLALDLINTEIAWRGKGRDLLQGPQDLAQWWELVQTQYSLEITSAVKGVNFDQALLDQIKPLRAALRRLASSVDKDQPLAETDLDELNQVLEVGSPRLGYDPDKGLKNTYYLHDTNPGKGLLFQLALSALQLFSGSDLSRLHKCRNERCVLYFYDNTKSGTRHWCSLGCMNRARSIQHYKESKEGKKG